MQRLFVFLVFCVLPNLLSTPVSAAEQRLDDKTITLAVETDHP
jgi:hypothetical protein